VGAFGSFFTFFLTWWGAFLMGALDTSMLFFLPLGIDALVIYLSARTPELFWTYPLLATAGSVAGAALTYWTGRRLGGAGLKRFVPERRLERLQQRVRDKGAIALAIPALLPPPFPLTPFILTCGALKVNPRRFFLTFTAMRLLRFGAESVLARVYGRRVLTILQSDTFQIVVIVFAVIAIAGTIASAVVLWRNSRSRQLSAA
jgi:membrane protein YqaA with SNARE-associated domain